MVSRRGSQELPPRRGIAFRLSLSFGAIIAAFGIVSIACLWALVDIHGRLHTVKDDEEKARSIVRLASAVRDQYAHVAHTIIIGNASHTDLFREAFAQVQTLAVAVRQKVGPAASRGPIDRIVDASNQIARLFEGEVLPLVASGQSRDLDALHERIMALAFRAQTDADALGKATEDAMEDLSRHVTAIQHGVIVFTVAAQVLALITAILVGWYLYRSIARPIALLSTAVTRIGTGDLKVQVPVERNDELGQLARRFNEMASAMEVHQAELLQAEKLAGLGRVAAGIAHELNNPVAVILGYAKLMQRRDGLSDQTMLQAIEIEAERCHQVIEGLLELTRGSNLLLSAMALRPLIEEVVTGLRIAGASEPVSIEIRGDAIVQGDEVKLRQVLTNLVRNAIEACGPTGRVTITVDKGPAGGVTVAVSDSGPGVRDEDQTRIFEPFFTRKSKGNGLGLAISRAIAHAHGGDIVLAARDGAGATFLLTLAAGTTETA